MVPTTQSSRLKNLNPPTPRRRRRSQQDHSRVREAPLSSSCSFTLMLFLPITPLQHFVNRVPSALRPRVRSSCFASRSHASKVSPSPAVRLRRVGFGRGRGGTGSVSHFHPEAAATFGKEAKSGTFARWCASLSLSLSQRLFLRPVAYPRFFSFPTSLSPLPSPFFIADRVSDGSSDEENDTPGAMPSKSSSIKSHTPQARKAARELTWFPLSHFERPH